MYKISVIIPVYNAEDSLKRAIDSVLNQKWEGDLINDVEIIIINDCSTDNSLNIIKDYAIKYKNIKYIDLKKNHGNPSTPRNLGIKKSNSEYILFLDADDYFVRDSINVLYDVMSSQDGDVLHFNHYKLIDDSFYRFKHILETKDYKILDNKEDALYLRATIWGNMFKSDLIKNNEIKFQEILYEDLVFSMETYVLADKVIVMKGFYGYVYCVENYSSLTHDVSLESVYSFFNGLKLFNKVILDNNLQKYEVNVMNNVLNFFYFLFFKLKISNKDKRKLLIEFRDFVLGFNGKVTLKSRPINFIHNLVMNKHYGLAIIVSAIAGFIYNFNSLKNWIFKKYSNLEKVE